jgi:hypothetical protein
MEATHQYVYVFLSALGNLLPVVGILPERGYKDGNELLVHPLRELGIDCDCVRLGRHVDRSTGLSQGRLRVLV